MRWLAERTAGCRAVARPFSWWVSGTDTPRDLIEILERAGLEEGESETAMAATLTDLRGAGAPDGPSIERVRTEAAIGVYARLLSVLWTAADQNGRCRFWWRMIVRSGSISAAWAACPWRWPR